MGVLDVIKSSPLFYELYDEEILKLVDKCNVLNLTPGEAIFNEGEEGDEIFLILNGSALVKKGEVTLTQLRKGDLFGEMALLREKIRHATVVCDNFTDVLVMSYQDIFGLYDTDKKTFSLLMVNLARLLATRLHKTGESMKKLAMENRELKEKCKAP